MIYAFGIGAIDKQMLTNWALHDFLGAMLENTTLGEMIRKYGQHFAVLEKDVRSKLLSTKFTKFNGDWVIQFIMGNILFIIVHVSIWKK